MFVSFRAIENHPKEFPLEGNSLAQAIKRRRKQEFDWHLFMPP